MIKLSFTKVFKDESAILLSYKNGEKWEQITLVGPEDRDDAFLNVQLKEINIHKLYQFITEYIEDNYSRLMGKELKME